MNEIADRLDGLVDQIERRIIDHDKIGPLKERAEKIRDELAELYQEAMRLDDE